MFWSTFQNMRFYPSSDGIVETSLRPLNLGPGGRSCNEPISRLQCSVACGSRKLPASVDSRTCQAVRVCLRLGMYHVLVLTELRQICGTGAQGDGSLLNALSRKWYMGTLQYVHRGTLP